MTLRETGRKWLINHPKINPYRYSRERLLQPYRIATGKYRVLPDFIILGEPRCGTTSLYYNLIKHPNIFPGSGKSAEFFTKNFHRGINYYKAHFDTKSFKNKILKMNQTYITGEATPTCFAHPLSGNRIANTIPKIKMIVIFRNPVDRAYSHYNYHKIRNEVKFDSFEDAINNELTIFSEQWKEKINVEEIDPEFSYLYTGMYIEHLQNYLNYFPKEQFLLLKMEDFGNNFTNILNQVFEFLDLPKKVIDNPKKMNAVPYSTMDSEIRKKLLEFFEPYNKKLEEYLGTNLPWNH